MTHTFEQNHETALRKYVTTKTASMSGGSGDPFPTMASGKTSAPDMSYDNGPTSGPPSYDNPGYTYQPTGIGVAPQPNVSTGVTPSVPPVPEPGRVIQQVQQVGEDFDDDQDYYSTKGHVKVTFDEIFNEPQNVTSFQPVRTVNSVVFEFTQGGIYKAFSTGLGVILAAVWGLAFGIFHFAIVWAVHPSLKMTFMSLRLAGLVVKASVRTLVDPVFQSCGLSLSSIAGKFSFKLSGIPEQRAENPTAANTIQNI